MIERGEWSGNVVVGQWFRDMDKRVGNRICVVDSIVSGKAVMRSTTNGGRLTRVSIRRLRPPYWQLIDD